MVEQPQRADSLPPRAGRRPNTLFEESADWYDRSVNWEARLKRELPLLCDVFGAPGPGGILDAGCGTGHQAVALAQRGYSVTGADASPAMLHVARGHAARHQVELRLECLPYEELAGRFGPVFDGVLCVGNSLAAAGSAAAAEQAIGSFAALLRPGGRLFVQVLNFPPMRAQSPYVRGPRVSVVDGVEYVSVGCFQFLPDPAAGRQGAASVTNVTLWNDGAWHKSCHSGVIYPLAPDELTEWCAQAGLPVRNTYGAYDRTAFDPQASADLILIAQRNE